MNNPIGYRIFFQYLDYIWNEEKPDCLGALLGGMSLLDDGSTADPAYEFDWNDAIINSKDQENPYQIGIQFLKDWLAIGYDKGIDKIRLDMESNKRLDLWQKASHDVLNNNDDPYLNLISN